MAKEKPEDSLEGYTSQVIRGPERSVKAMLLAQHLILSISSPPLKAILHIVQAASMFSEEDMEKLKIDPEEVDILLTVSLTIGDATLTSLHPSGNPNMYAIMASNLDYEKYFKPWSKCLYYPHIYGREEEDSPRALAIEQANNGGDPSWATWESLKTLSLSGYEKLKTEFCRWATPRAQRIAEKISTKVDSGTYGDVMKMIQKPIEAKI